MGELTRQGILDELAQEKDALLDLLSRFDDEEWETLARADGWRVHDIAAHIADVHLTTVATSGLASRPSHAEVGVTLPIQSNGRVDQDRLNALRYRVNRELSREAVMARLYEAFTVLRETIERARLAGPGPYGPPETMLEWFYAAVSHNRTHRLELQTLFETRDERA